MAAAFAQLDKLKESAIIHTREWNSNIFDNYSVLKNPTTLSGKAANAPYEEMDVNLYNSQAHMLGFRVKSAQPSLFWIKFIACRYYLIDESSSNHRCEWLHNITSLT
jgi:hypothetical protein